MWRLKKLPNLNLRGSNLNDLDSLVKTIAVFQNRNIYFLSTIYYLLIMNRYFRGAGFFSVLFVFLCTVNLQSCNLGQHDQLFWKLPSSSSGINFINQLTYRDSLSVLDFEYMFNGGGVALVDVNNDGLEDIFFTGNMVSCKLYLNKGNFQFEDVTQKAGVEGMGRWARGVSVIDINNDGLMDIYICNTIYKDSLRKRNILYVNQGKDKEGIPHFKDMAAEYGLDIHVQSTMASFFDYDNDGDLDMYLTVNEASI